MDNLVIHLYFLIGEIHFVSLIQANRISQESACVNEKMKTTCYNTFAIGDTLSNGSRRILKHS